MQRTHSSPRPRSRVGFGGGGVRCGGVGRARGTGRRARARGMRSYWMSTRHTVARRALAARFLTYRAAWLLDRGRRVTKESAMAKLFASEAAVQIANEALQIHGGYGFIKDYPVEKFYRDIKLCTIGEGTSEIQTLVIARQLLSPNDQLTVACGQ